MQRTAAVSALVAFVLTLGCSTLRDVPISDVRPSERVASVTLGTGEWVQFDEEGGLVNTYRGTIDGTRLDGTTVGIPLKDVVAVEAMRTDTTRTVVWTTLAIATLAAGAAILLSNN